MIGHTLLKVGSKGSYFSGMIKNFHHDVRLESWPCAVEDFAPVTEASRAGNFLR